MLRNPTIYAQSTMSPDKPVWHWSDLFVGSADLRGMDLDYVGFYCGRPIFIESKPLGTRISKHQSEVLESLAALPRSVVLLVGTLRDDLFNERAIVTRWVQVTPDGSWRSGRWVVTGTDTEFRAFIADLKRTIDLAEAPTNDDEFTMAA
jgi:hypothetical protein